jgi:hypothetical protein
MRQPSLGSHEWIYAPAVEEVKKKEQEKDKKKGKK